MNNSEKPSDETDMCHFAPGTGTCKLKKKKSQRCDEQPLCPWQWQTSVLSSGSPCLVQSGRVAVL